MTKAEKIVGWVVAILTIFAFFLDHPLSYYPLGKYIPYIIAGLWAILAVIVWRAAFSTDANNIWKYILLAFLMTTVFFAGWAGNRAKGLHEGNVASWPISTQLSYVAQNALERKDYDAAISIAYTCSSYDFQSDAERRQLDLETMQKPPYPVGVITDASVIDEISSNYVLNDYAMCLWVKAQAYEGLNRIEPSQFYFEAAISSYNDLRQFTYARVVDLDGTAYWSPAALVDGQINSLAGP
jgi:hypothetical protein